MKHFYFFIACIMMCISPVLLVLFGIIVFFYKIVKTIRKKYRENKIIVASVCGHKTRISGEICVFGKMVSVELPADGTRYCLECLGKMSIQCASCGEAIYPGSGVSSICFADGDLVPEYAVSHPSNDGAYLGCLSGSCSISGGGFTGHWIIPGEFRSYNFT